MLCWGYWCLNTYIALGILVLKYVYCTGHTGARYVYSAGYTDAWLCRLCLVYWCLDMETVLGILVSTYVDCAGHTGAYIWCSGSVGRKG